jgi:hypothetical protein
MGREARHQHSQEVKETTVRNKLPWAIVLVLVLVLVLTAGPGHVVRAFENLTVWTTANVDPTNSSGTVEVLLKAGVPSRPTIPINFTLVNHDTVEHTAWLLSGTTKIVPFIIPAGGYFFESNSAGTIRTANGGDLKFKIDISSGATTSVTFAGEVLQ